MGIIKKWVRALRKNQTEAEKFFWNKVRNNQLGLNFRRQYPLVYYVDSTRKLFIADFICKEKKLVIEIDGGIHELQKEYDEARTSIINQLGYKVLRFTNDQVFNNFSEIKKVLSPLGGER